VETLSNLDWESFKKDRAVRSKIGARSFYWFFHLYFSHYIEFATADFQKEMMSLASDESVEHLVILAFRSSGKSTIITTALPLWAVMGTMQKKYVVIVSQTQNQAQQHLKNIALEIEKNNLICKDFFPYDLELTDAGVSTISLPGFGAKIIAVSREQGVRGLRSGQYRPDLVIADDVEDTNSVKTMEARSKTYNWFTGELLPLGSESTKFITIGNLLHEDSLIMRLKSGIDVGERNGHFVSYPLLDENQKPLWLSRFPNALSVEQLQKRIGNRVTWEREYMLHLVPDGDQVITRDMIHTYSVLPRALQGEYRRIIVGVDLAISESNKADFTAILTIDVRGKGEVQRIYVMPYPINRRMSFPATITQLKDVHGMHARPKLYIEQVAYQAAAVQVLRGDGLNVTGVIPRSDKRTRLNMISDKISRGIILFPQRGANELITQLVGFGVEKHDDLVDALTIAVLEFVRDERAVGTVHIGRSNIYQTKPETNRRRYWDIRTDDFDEATS